MHHFSGGENINQSGNLAAYYAYGRVSDKSDYMIQKQLLKITEYIQI